MDSKQREDLITICDGGQDDNPGSPQNPIEGYTGSRLYQTPGGVPFVFVDMGMESWNEDLPGVERCRGVSLRRALRVGPGPRFFRSPGRANAPPWKSPRSHRGRDL